MYPFFRAGRVLAGGLRRHPMGTLTASTLKMRVWPNDLDTNLHMNNGRYLTLMDLGRFDLMIKCGLLPVIVRQRWYPVAGGAMIRFNRPLHAFEKFTLASDICGWDARWLYFRHDLVSGDKLAATALVRGLFRCQGRSIPVAELLTSIGYDGPAIDPPASAVSWSDADKLMLQTAP